MQIAGIQKTTLVDYEGLVAATIFTRGCPFRCPFCHNPELVIPEQYIPLMDNDEIWKFLESRVGKIDGICITGGEPVLQPDLADFIAGVKQLGFKIKLDSNGHNAAKLTKLINTGNIDYIAMDIKGPLAKYETIAYGGFCNIDDKENIKVSTQNISHQKIKELRDNIQDSVRIIMSSGIAYEFRTTLVKPLHTIHDMCGIGKLIKGADRYYLQNYIQSKHICNSEFQSFSNTELEEMRNMVQTYVKNAQIRQ